jgi:AcrR family transcriptional regulator
MMKSASRRMTAPERRERVLAAALRRFAEVGYDAASMNAIAAAAGITKPVLYDYFPSKQELFAAVLEGIRDNLLARGAAVSTRHASREQRFRFAIEAFFRFADEHPEAMRVLLLVPQTSATAAMLSKKVQAGATAGIASFLHTLCRPMESRRLQAAAELLKAGLHALAEWRIDGPQTTREEVVDLVMQVVWQGLGASGRDRSGRRRG